MKIIKGNICTPQGFLSTGISAGLKKKQKKDLALIYSQKSAVAAAVFTTNLIKAAPILLTQQHIQSGHLQAVVINSGNANACTGTKGMENAQIMANATANALDLAPEQVAVASTGVIGVHLPIEKITQGIAMAAQSLTSDPKDDSAAIAILTTDTFTKCIAVECELGGKIVRIGGIAKGSGMIHPMMATMLAFITTDAAIDPAILKMALIQANEDSFQMVTIDGDTSTNDMALILANGMAENIPITSLDSPDGQIFLAALRQVCSYLAQQIAIDGEGATKFIEVHVQGANSMLDAKIAARAVCKSSLVKTAIFGEDANWGRIAAALGSCGVAFDPNHLSIHLGTLLLFQHGIPLPFDETIAQQYLQQKHITITANLGQGTGFATGWGCDLTYDYVKINASYRS